MSKAWRESGSYEVEATHPGPDGLAEIVRRPINVFTKAKFV